MTLPKFGDYIASRNGVEVALPDEIASQIGEIESDSPAMIKNGDGDEIARATVYAGGAKALVFAPGVTADDIGSVELIQAQDDDAPDAEDTDSTDDSEED